MSVQLLDIAAGVQPRATYRVTLDDSDFVLQIRWNGREAVGILDVFDADLVPLVLGCPLRANRPCLADFNVNGLPQGDFYMLDVNGKGEPTQEGFGSDWLFAYVELS